MCQALFQVLGLLRKEKVQIFTLVEVGTEWAGGGDREDTEPYMMLRELTVCYGRQKWTKVKRAGNCKWEALLLVR